MPQRSSTFEEPHDIRIVYQGRDVRESRSTLRSVLGTMSTYLLLNMADRAVTVRSSSITTTLPLALIATGSAKLAKAVRKCATNRDSVAKRLFLQVAFDPWGFSMSSAIADRVMGWHGRGVSIQDINRRVRDIVWAGNSLASAADPSARIFSTESLGDPALYRVKGGSMETGTPFVYVTSL